MKVKATIEHTYTGFCISATVNQNVYFGIGNTIELAKIDLKNSEMEMREVCNKECPIPDDITYEYEEI